MFERLGVSGVCKVRKHERLISLSLLVKHLNPFFSRIAVISLDDMDMSIPRNFSGSARNCNEALNITSISNNFFMTEVYTGHIGLSSPFLILLVTANRR